MRHLDTVILGGGPGGYHSALLLKRNGVDVAVIEKNKVGGTCLHAGCIPTKSLLNSAKHISGDINLEEIIGKKNSDVNKLYRGLTYQLQSAEIPVINGAGKLRNRGGDIIVSVDDEEISCKHIILATGSSNVTVNIPGLAEAVENGRAVYSDAFLNLTSIPEKVAIIGGGVIGLEFASYLSMINRKVTVIEGRDEILRSMLDADCVSLYKAEIERSGINLVTDALVEEIDGDNIVYQVNENYVEQEFDLIIVACGRKANIDNIGLENVELDVENGFVVVNSRCKTSIPNIYACGDLIGNSMLAHAAYMEAEVIVDDILGKEREISYESVPSVIYTNPEVAFVGKSEEYCKLHDIPYYVKKESMLFSGRYLVEHGSFPGICKLIFSQDGVLIGAQMVGNSCSETIFSLADMIANRSTIDEIISKCYPHPSFVEIIKEVASSKAIL